MYIKHKSEVTCVDVMGTDLSVVNAARVSFNKESKFVTTEDGSQVLSEGDQKLIKYLADHNHWTPFGHCCISLHISAPMFVARQLFKHTVGGVINEVSRRYVDSPPAFFIPNKWRARHENKKQGSYSDKFVNIDQNAINRMMDINLNTYNALLTAGVCPEQARMVLPQNMMVEWHWTGSLFFFARVCNLRLSSHAQQETQDVANQIYSILLKHFPVSAKHIIKQVDESA